MAIRLQPSHPHSVSEEFKKKKKTNGKCFEFYAITMLYEHFCTCIQLGTSKSFSFVHTEVTGLSRSVVMCIFGFDRLMPKYFTKLNKFDTTTIKLVNLYYSFHLFVNSVVSYFKIFANLVSILCI